MQSQHALQHRNKSSLAAFEETPFPWHLKARRLHLPSRSVSALFQRTVGSERRSWLVAATEVEVRRWGMVGGGEGGGGGGRREGVFLTGRTMPSIVHSLWCKDITVLVNY